MKHLKRLLMITMALGTFHSATYSMSAQLPHYGFGCTSVLLESAKASVGTFAKQCIAGMNGLATVVTNNKKAVAVVGALSLVSAAAYYWYKTMRSEKIVPSGKPIEWKATFQDRIEECINNGWWPVRVSTSFRGNEQQPIIEQTIIFEYQPEYSKDKESSKEAFLKHVRDELPHGKFLLYIMNDGTIEYITAKGITEENFGYQNTENNIIETDYYNNTN